MSEPEPLRLNPDLGVAAHRRRYDERSRVHVSDFLESQSAKRILTCLEMERRWNLVTHLGGKHVDFDFAAMAKRSAADRAQFLQLVHAQAERSFEYLYLSYPIYQAYHDRKAPGHFLNTVLEFLNSDEVLGVLRSITGAKDVAFIDAQATRYDRGHFLTMHDDESDSNSRRTAYVLSLTPEWQSDWGGLTLFYDAKGDVEEAFQPRFNSLNLFRVPQPHSVSMVAPFAPRARFSVTGWLHAGEDPRGKIGQP
ncbi:MAG: 2OG-Fe(II) oxygenase family protein [Parvularculaceae bacterium]